MMEKEKTELKEMKIRFDYEDKYITMKLNVKGKLSVEFISKLYKAIMEAEEELLERE